MQENILIIAPRLVILLYTYNIYAHKTQFSFTTRNVAGF